MAAPPAPHWPELPRPPKGTPNLLVILFDDVGFADFGCYGSAIRTPHIDALAARGLRYSGFHTTADAADAGGHPAAVLRGLPPPPFHPRSPNL